MNKLAKIVGLLVNMVLLLGSVATLPGCDRENSIVEDELEVLGTFAQITIVGLPKERARAAALAVEQDLKSIGLLGYTFENPSELQRLNDALAWGRPMKVSDSLLALIKQAKLLYEKSGGVFNPAKGELTAFWEFECHQEACSESPYPAEVQKLVDQEIQKILIWRPTMEDVIVEQDTVRSRNPKVKLEFGDMIRGFALDKGIEHLKQLGVQNAQINIGGSVRTLGMRGSHDWWIGLPDETGKHTIGSLENIDDQSVVTVRAFDQSFGKQGLVYRHIVNPTTGQPVKDIKSVTVMHENAIIANAFAVAMHITGTENWKSLADKMDVHKILVIGADGTIYTSPAMASIVHWNQGVSRQLLVP